MNYFYMPLNSDPIVQWVCTNPSGCFWRRNKFRYLL